MIVEEKKVSNDKKEEKINEEDCNELKKFIVFVNDLIKK